MGGYTTFLPTQRQPELQTNHRCLNRRCTQHHEGQDFSNFTPGNHSLYMCCRSFTDAMLHITNVPLFFRLYHTDRDVISTGEHHDHPPNRQQRSQLDPCRTGWYKAKDPQLHGAHHIKTVNSVNQNDNTISSATRYGQCIPYRNDNLQDT